MNKDDAVLHADEKQFRIRIRSTRVALAALLALVVATRLVGLSAPEDECARTSQMRIYSNAYPSKETGDVLGIELALSQNNDSTVDALLYIYEGAANVDGIHLPGRIAGKRVTVEGNWEERLVEYPSKREVVQTHFVSIDGTLDSKWFRGRIKIQGLSMPAAVKLERVKYIWVCKR